MHAMWMSHLCACHASLPNAALRVCGCSKGVQAQGQDLVSLLQQALLMQQLQSAQQHQQQQTAGSKFHAVPLQQLLAGTQLDLSGAPGPQAVLGRPCFSWVSPHKMHQLFSGVPV